jgi:hypothetical protein
MSIESTQALFDKLLATDKRRAAEVAYVLARLHLAGNDKARAEKLARQSIQLFESCDTSTLNECAALFVTLDGVALPSIIHADVVRERFPQLGL